jgi:hypothetical protein
MRLWTQGLFVFKIWFAIAVPEPKPGIEVITKLDAPQQPQG